MSPLQCVWRPGKYACYKQLLTIIVKYIFEWNWAISRRFKVNGGGASILYVKLAKILYMINLKKDIILFQVCTWYVNKLTSHMNQIFPFNLLRCTYLHIYHFFISTAEGRNTHSSSNPIWKISVTSNRPKTKPKIWKLHGYVMKIGFSSFPSRVPPIVDFIIFAFYLFCLWIAVAKRLWLLATICHVYSLIRRTSHTTTGEWYIQGASALKL